VRTTAMSAVGVVAASGGYPGSAEGGKNIEGLDTLDPGVLCFHAGTRRERAGSLSTAGGRVLCVVARAATLAGARDGAYENLSRVHFDGMQFRHDIGAGVMM
jgi:phosphoribosylamine--glycine ligase